MRIDVTSDGVGLSTGKGITLGWEPLLGVIAGMGTNGVTVAKLLMILELCLELNYFLSQIFIVVTVTEVTKVPKFLI